MLGHRKEITTTAAHCNGIVSVHPRKIASDDKLRHDGVVGVVHGDGTGFKPELNGQLTYLQCIVVGHNEIASESRANREKRLVVNVEVFVTVC